MKTKICLFLLLASCALCLTQQANAQQAVIKEFYGTVELKAAGSAVWVKAADWGSPLERNTAISTGFKSTAILKIGNSTLTVRPLTKLTLEEIIQNQGNEQINLNLQTGRVRAQVIPPAGGRTSLTVKGPIATASVRGTVFDFDTLNLDVEEGAVIFSGENGRTVTVYAGGSSTVDAVTGQAAGPRETAAAELYPAMPAGSDSGMPLVTDDIGGTIEFAVDLGW
jgi:hypothetical protein